MFKLFKQLLQIIAALFSALEKTAQAINHVASVAEKTSEGMALEARLRSQERLAELNRQIAAKQLSAPVNTEVGRSHSSRQMGHAVSQTAPPPHRERQLEAARIAAQAEVERVGERLLRRADGANPSLGLVEAPPYAQAIEYVERLEVAPIERNRQSRILLRRRYDRVSSGGSEARDIQEGVAQRGIEYLVHFTREVNLPSILRRGLVTRDVLRAEGSENTCNDRYRLDGTDAVCASIGFPNYKMFYGLRQEEKSVDWILLTIDPSVLWTTAVAFCTANAASKVVTETPLQQRMGLAAMEAMFSDFGEKARAALSLPDSFPTNPQAEVLLLDGVPRRHISGVIALDEAQKARIEANGAGLQVVTNAGWYRWRSDYEHWR